MTSVSGEKTFTTALEMSACGLNTLEADPLSVAAVAHVQRSHRQAWLVMAVNVTVWMFVESELEKVTELGENVPQSEDS